MTPETMALQIRISQPYSGNCTTRGKLYIADSLFKTVGDLTNDKFFAIKSRRFQKQQQNATSTLALNHSQRYPSTAAMNAAAMTISTAAKRSQSVESLLSRIPHCK